MKRRLKSKTTVWKYDDRTIIHTITKPEQDIYYFSGNDTPFEWNKGGYIDINAPKPHFITRFKNRLKNLLNFK